MNLRLLNTHSRLWQGDPLVVYPDVAEKLLYMAHMRTLFSYIWQIEEVYKGGKKSKICAVYITKLIKFLIPKSKQPKLLSAETWNAPESKHLGITSSTYVYA